MPDKESFRESFDRGVALINRGEYDGAAAALSRALSLSPGSALTLNLLGICRFQQKNYPAARSLFERSAAADPTYAQAYNNLAGVHFVQGEYERSEATFKKALEIKPNLVSALYSLGNLYLAGGRTEEGMSFLARAIALDPSYLEVHQALITQAAHEGFRAVEAYVLYARLFARAGDATRTLYYLGKADEAGFEDWKRVLTDADFDKVRDAPTFQDFLRARLKF